MHSCFVYLDNGNLNYICASQSSLSCLQLVQTATPSLLIATQKSVLHWLPVRFRFLSLASFLITDVTPYSTTKALSLADLGLLTTPSTRLRFWYDYAFLVFTSKLWISVPLSIRCALEGASFMRGKEPT